MGKGTPLRERGDAAVRDPTPGRRDTCHGINYSDSLQPARRFSSPCPSWGPPARGSIPRITGTSTTGTGTTGGDTMRGRTARTDATGLTITGADTAGTVIIGTSRTGAGITGMTGGDTSIAPAGITGMAGGETGITYATTGPDVNTGTGITPRHTCTLPTFTCRASTCTSCSRCNDGREIIGPLAVWSVSHADRTVLYRGRFR